MAGNPLQRAWFVMHLASRQLPQVALAFEQFLVLRGQPYIEAQLRFPSRAPVVSATGINCSAPNPRGERGARPRARRTKVPT